MLLGFALLLIFIMIRSSIGHSCLSFTRRTSFVEFAGDDRNTIYSFIAVTDWCNVFCNVGGARRAERNS